MATTKDNPFQEFLDAPLVKKYLFEIVSDTEAALTQAAKNLSSASLKQCTASSLSTYKKDISYLEKSSDKFHNEWGNVIAGKAKNLSAFQTAYQDLLSDLEIAEMQNFVFKAVVDADLGVKLAAFFPLLVPLSAQAKAFFKLKSDLAAIKKDLEKANRAATSKTVKAVLGAAVAGATLATGPLGIGATIGVALATTAAGLVIDEVLGNGGSVAPLDTAGKASETALDCYDQLDRVKIKGLGPMLAVVGIAKDSTDAAAAIIVKTKIEARIKTFEKDYNKAVADLKKLIKDIPKAQTNAFKAYDAAVKQASGFKSKESVRKKAIKEFKNYNNYN